MKNLLMTTETKSFDDYGFYIVYNPTTKSISVDKGYKVIDFKQLIKISTIIRNLAEKYISDNNLTIKPDLLLSQYGRIERYTGTTWSMVGGNLPEDFQKIVNKEQPLFPKIETIVLPNGETLDAPHFWAVINTLYNNQGDLGGWAGDLVQFASDLKTNPSAPFPSGSFGEEDWRSDADAANIYKFYSNNIIEGMKVYFTKNLTEQERIDRFITSDTILTRFNNSPSKLLLTILMKQYGVSDITVAADRMQNYLDENKTK